MEKVRYEEMLPHEIVSRRRKCPAAFVPLGGLEWHGEHLAVGNDALKAGELCKLAAAASGGFAMPPVWFGEPRTVALMEASHDEDERIAAGYCLPHANFTTKHFGIAERDQVEFYIRLIHHVLVQMNTLGFRAVVLLSGHYPLKRWADAAIRRFHRAKRFAGTRAYCGIEFHFHRPENHRIVGGDHAALWETSYLMYLRPDCVDMTVYHGRDDEELVGVRGQDPRGTASVETARRACKLIVKGMVATARQLIRQAR